MYNPLRQIEEPLLMLPAAYPAERSCTAQVVLGTPSNGCQGLGLCKIYMANRPLPIPCPAMSARLSATVQGRLCLRISKTQLHDAAREKYFPWQLFPTTESFVLPGWLCRKLGLAQQCIEPGVYGVWESDTELSITF